MNPFATRDAFEDLRSAASKPTRFSALRRRLLSRSEGTQYSTIVSERTMRMLLLAVASAPATLLVGPPGTGKTRLMQTVAETLSDEYSRYGFESPLNNGEIVTPEEDWTYADLVLGQAIQEGRVVSEEGSLLQAIGANQWLLLDEANRADMDRIFGGLLTWLSRDRVRIGSWMPSSGDAETDSSGAYPAYLSWSDGDPECRVSDTPGVLRDYVAGTDWRLVGTYNAIDSQRVFQMGQALSRRFKHVPIHPPTPNEFKDIISARVEHATYSADLIAMIVALYGAHYSVDGARLGPGLFVDMPNYVRLGMPVEESGDAQPAVQGSQPLASDIRETLEDLVAEAYVTSVGSLIARMASSTLNGLGEAIANSRVFNERTWDWVSAQLEVM